MMAERYSTKEVGEEAAKYITDRRAHDPNRDSPELRADANWFANRLREILVPRASWRFGEYSDAHSKVRFSPELDAFEFLNNMIPRDELPSVISMLLFALDDADQARFECSECKQSRGFFKERGFQRCNVCGYPGQ